MSTTMRRWGFIIVLIPVLVTSAGAADHPLPADWIMLRAGRAPSRAASAKFVLRDPAIAPPFTTPPAGATLRVSGGAGAGQCRVDLRLASAGWSPVGGDGTARGYRYRDTTSGGVLRIAIRPGLITLRARGDRWPCDLGAAQRQVTVDLALGDERYCASFGGTVLANSPGRFLARAAPAPAACPKTDLTVADLNILHGATGTGCPATDNCRLSERVDLLFQWIAASGCPDVVTLQEVRNLDPGNAIPLIQAHLATACPFQYEMAYKVYNHNDDPVILSRFPIVPENSELRVLWRGFRAVLFARIDHPIGPVDVFTTHLASGSDGASLPCTTGCPAECVAAGAATVRKCQAVQVARFVEQRHDVAGPAVITGDFNEEPGSFVYRQFVDRGWADAHLAAGNPECDPATGAGCTSGRIDDTLEHLEAPASNLVERIDFIFLVPPAPESTCAGGIDSAADADSDGIATKIFTDDPNPFSPSCGPRPAPICWPSDHEGVQLDVNCAAQPF